MAPTIEDAPGAETLLQNDPWATGESQDAIPLDEGDIVTGMIDDSQDDLASTLEVPLPEEDEIPTEELLDASMLLEQGAQWRPSFQDAETGPLPDAGEEVTPWVEQTTGIKPFEAMLREAGSGVHFTATDETTRIRFSQGNPVVIGDATHGEIAVVGQTVKDLESSGAFDAAKASQEAATEFAAGNPGDLEDIHRLLQSVRKAGAHFDAPITAPKATPELTNHYIFCIAAAFMFYFQGRQEQAVTFDTMETYYREQTGADPSKYNPEEFRRVWNAMIQLCTAIPVAAPKSETER